MRGLPTPARKASSHERSEGFPQAGASLKANRSRLEKGFATGSL